MPKSIAFTGQVEWLQILDEEGRLDEELARDTLSDVEVKYLYEQMILCRIFDEAAFKLQRSGRMGTFPQNKGHEAVSLGAARALRRGIDYLVPYYRDNAAMFLHGLPLHYILLHWMGDERGNAIPRGLAMNPISVVIGAQTLHAVGIAWAFMMRGEDRIVLCSLGDGATSTGDFHEAMNFAGIYKPPVVFSCANNGYAISTACCRQTGSATFAQKALAYGIPAIRVDGNDLFAVYKAHRDAAEHARSGQGPYFIESLTYRLGDHTTADDARRYRPAEELEAAQKRDPLVRTRKYLQSRGLWDEDQERRVQEQAEHTVKEVVEMALSMARPSPEDLFDYTYAALPRALARQRDTRQTDAIGQRPGQVGLSPAAPVEEAKHVEMGK